ncbi:major facilitator superfamily domain-containing protein 1-like isoform X1 [Mytilus californianus]|uniref:major facilitator superfamily domain-containing protein 1-like isoform X1 n=2 Tax=Mytilus californianus TaxID=6549 RepID=UPI002247E9DC|nr:major facilitator superfamily domain-containing protein 1-like isoform X1 [Mytilus californianus]
MEATDRSYRFLLLFFNCMLTFGSYFCFDMPSVLQAQFTGVSNCTDNSTKYDESCECEGCLGMSNDDYNLLYAIYAWTNAVVVIGAGFLIDKLGNRIGLFLFSFLCVLGSSTFAAGVFFKGTSAMLPVMLIGRLLFGSGNGSLTIVQNRITAYWFRNKELAMAFGITLAFSRLGSVLNFFMTQIFEDSYGLTWTLWAGAILCGLGFISSFIVSFMDIYGVRQLGDEQNLQTESKKLKVTDIKYFSMSYWLLALTIMFFYNGVFPFVADASDFIFEKYKDKYDFSKRTSSILAGAVYDVSMVLSPFLGGLIDVIGMRGVLALTCALLTIPVFGILAFTYVYPLVATLWLGITYSFAAASMWPSIPLVVSQATVGTAMGLTTSIQMIGIGISNLVVGQILGKSQDLSREDTLLRWKYVMIYLLANSLACVATTTILNLNDKRRGGILNLSRKQKMAIAEQVAKEIEEEDERRPLLRDGSKPSIN